MLLSRVFLRCDPLGLAGALPPQMIPLSDLLLTLRLRPTSDLELLRLLSGDNASDLKSRANALLACSNGLTGDFVARCNACVRSRSPANMARFLANDAAGVSLGGAAGFDCISEAGVSARDTRSPVMPSLGYSCPSPPSYGRIIGT